jgi:predicted ATPase/DNA-binding winged helix-turn-helix (wHTH) protein
LLFQFDNFLIDTNRRELTGPDGAIHVEPQVFDLLVHFVQNTNRVISKDELIEKIWNARAISDAALNSRINSVRRAIGDTGKQQAFIRTVQRRGFLFAAEVTIPVSRSNDRNPTVAARAAAFVHANLPGSPTGLIDREDDLQKLAARLDAARFVTIVGVGGVGKTTLAIALGYQLIDVFAGAALFVDLGALSGPELVATTVASMLGLSVRSDDTTSDLIGYLRDKRILLILDTCEHLIEAVAALASRIFREAPRVHIVATSREALQVGGEFVYRLDPLACPPDDAVLTAATARIFPATQLFVERAAASGVHLNLNDAEAAIVVNICRKLDGVALAIELAAKRVEAFGLHQTATLLEQHLTLLWLGPRTAPPRQKTLQATLDWSYGLLSEIERVVLRPLAVFVGHFTLDAVLEVVTSATLDRSTVLGAIDRLVAKSMVATRPIGDTMCYRLLDTTRAYVLNVAIDDAEAADLSVRHATYYRRWLERHGAEWPTLTTGIERAHHYAAIDNVRAALEWCFGANGDAQVGIVLAAAAAPVFLAMSLVAECNRWSERAILALDDAARGGLQEMQLQAALGVSLIITRGGREAARLALERGLAIAEDRGDVFEQVRLLGPLSMFHRRSGDYNTALQYAKHCSALARTTEDPVAIVLAHSNLGLSLQPVGELIAARTEFEAAIAHGSGSLRNATIYSGMDGNVLAGAALAVNLWLEGHPAQAIERARQTVQEAARTDHAASLSTALLNAISVLLWAGDLASASEHIDMLISRAESHSLGPFHWLGRGFRGEVAIRRGDVQRGVEALKGSLEKLQQARYNLFTSTLSISLIQGLVTMGRHAEAIALTGHTIGLVAANGNHLYTPELLRVKGRVLLAMGRPNVDAEMCFVQSLELSRRQGARAWELRSAIDLAALWAGLGRSADARALLLPAFKQFTEGLDTADLTAAERLLTTLN